MPAVATKVDKVASSDVNNNSTTTGISDKKMNVEAMNEQQQHQSDPVKIANQIIEKKIRNLEKRKARLLELKGEEDKGKHLEAEQKEAVKKLDNVIELIDTVKEIKKNVNDALSDYQKQLKKQAKKDQQERLSERNKEEHERLKLWVQGQYVLGRFPLCKDDLIQSGDEQVKVNEKEVEALEKLVEFTTNASSALPSESLDKLVLILEGSKKEFVAGLSYLEVKTTLQRLVRSKYFDTVPLVHKVEDKFEPEVAEPTKPEEEVQPLSQASPISFLNRLDTDLHKDPAVVAVAASTASQVFTSAHFYPNATVSMDSIPSQTFTNQSLMAHVAGNPEMAAYMPVNVAQVGQQLAALNIGGATMETGSAQVNTDASSNDTSQQHNSEPGKLGAHNAGAGFSKRLGPRGPPRPGQNGRSGGFFHRGNRFGGSGGGGGGKPNGHFGAPPHHGHSEGDNNGGTNGERAPPRGGGGGERGERNYRPYNGGPPRARPVGGPNKFSGPKSSQPTPAQ